MSQSNSANPSDSASARRRWALVVYMLFFLSGLTSLVYEVIWVRQFGLVLGITTYAVSTVLSAFFAGLALGSYTAGRVIDRTRLHPLVVYGVMEGLLGLYALLLPVLLRLMESAYPLLYSQFEENFTLFTLFRFVASFVVLAVPTTLMGATLPVLSKLMVDREDVLGTGVGRLYAVNTFGAVTGTFAAGFLLIPALGIAAATRAAVAGNFFLAVMAIAISTSPDLAPLRRTEGEDAEREAPPPRRLGRAERVILALAFVSGLATLALEVVWFRSLVLILGSTTYAFSTMLTAVLVGIALGSAVFARRADRMRNRAATVSVLLFVGGLCAVMGPAIINRLPFLFLRLYDWTYGVWYLLIATQFAVCFLLVFVPTFLSGGSFPILVRMYSLGVERVGRTVADVYAINTLGGIFGSLLGGFVLVKFFGMQPSLTIAALFLMLAGGVLAMSIAKPWSGTARGSVAAAMVAVVVILSFVHPTFATKLLFAGWGPYGGGYYASWMGGSTVDVTDRHMQRPLYHKEGVTASVDVLETGWGDKIISINAKPVATTYVYDMRALKMLGHLPVLLHPNPKDALIIGLGAGVSSGIIASYPTVENVTVVELCEEVPEGAEQFADWNHNALDRPELRVVINDGANYVKATRKQYDVISADPIHPFVSGAGTLYSREHWQICKARLRDGGILAQWLPLYQLSPTDFATVVGTFVDVFPNATMWFCGIDTVLIGGKGEFRIDPDRIAGHMSDPEIMADLLSMGVHRVGDVLGWLVADSEQMRQMGLGAIRNTADLPILEFSAPKAVALRGVASTMPALLTAVEQVGSQESRRRLNRICTRPLDQQMLQDIEATRRAGEWLMRGQMLYSYGYLDQYLQAAAQANAIQRTNRFVTRSVADAQYVVGDQRLADGYPREAFDYFSAAYANDPTNTMALTGAIRAALQHGDTGLAERTLALASRQQEDVFQVQVYRGWLALRRLEYDAARRALEAAGAHGQESPLMHVGLGFLALREGRPGAGNEHFGRAVAIATNPLDTLHSIVELCAEREFVSEAKPFASALVDAATRAIAAQPGTSYLYDYRAEAYSALGEERQAARDRDTSRSLVGWWEETPAGGIEDIAF